MTIRKTSSAPHDRLHAGARRKSGYWSIASLPNWPGFVWSWMSWPNAPVPTWTALQGGRS